MTDKTKMPEVIWLHPDAAAHPCFTMERPSDTKYIRADICPDGLECSGDGRDCVGDGLCKITAVPSFDDLAKVREALEAVKQDSINHDIAGLEIKTVGSTFDGKDISECLSMDTRLKCEAALQILDKMGGK